MRHERSACPCERVLGRPRDARANAAALLVLGSDELPCSDWRGLVGVRHYFVPMPPGVSFNMVAAQAWDGGA